MKFSPQLLLSSAATLLVLMTSYLALAEGASLAEENINELTAKKELLFLAKIIGPLKALARETDELAALVERAASDRDFAMDLAKRQGAWDMDYGWGGGRFGKRSGPPVSSGKRYDSFGIAGRFGRSVDRVEKENN